MTEKKASQTEEQNMDSHVLYCLFEYLFLGSNGI